MIRYNNSIKLKWKTATVITTKNKVIQNAAAIMDHYQTSLNGKHQS